MAWLKHRRRHAQTADVGADEVQPGADEGEDVILYEMRSKSIDFEEDISKFEDRVLDFEGDVLEIEDAANNVSFDLHRQPYSHE